MIKLKCKKCGNEWEYNGQKEYWATCPNCLNKVKIKKEVGKSGELL
jgi:DNA-directed RNA polymerase subunit RPC12/RpoP